MTIEAFRYEIPRRDSEDEDVFFTHIACGQELPCWRVATVGVTGTRLEYEKCVECGKYLDNGEY